MYILFCRVVYIIFALIVHVVYIILQSDSDDDGDSDGDDDDDDIAPTHPDDKALPDNFRDISGSVNSLRIDKVLGFGLNLTAS